MFSTKILEMLQCSVQAMTTFEYFTKNLTIIILQKKNICT